MQVNGQVNQYQPYANNPTANKINEWLKPIETGATNFNQALYTGTTQAMGGDNYQATGNASVQVQKVPLRQFFDDTMRPPHPLDHKIASRLSMVGINDSQEFLEAANTPFKRKLISYLAGGLFLNKNDRNYVNYQVAAWAGQADLMRTGVSMQTARLMQTSGAGDIPNLTRYNNPVEKGALYAAMAANAIQYGYYMPSFGEVSSAIERSRQLPPEIRW